MTHRIPRPVRQLLNIAIASTLILFSAQVAQADEHGMVRHTVVKGDTLWGLADQYLDSPWQWPELWQENGSIDNPNLIYPGDVLLISATSIRAIRSVTLRTDLPTDKLEPRIRRSKSTHGNAITTIEPEAILPFITQSIIVEPGELDSAAYVIQGTADEIVLGKGSRFFARGLTEPNIAQYKIFRIGSPVKDPVTEEFYGIEGVHLGNATLVSSEDDISVLQITRANQGIRPGDRLVPLKDPILLPYYFPRKPDTQIDTRIIKIPKGVNEAGRRDIVLISGGSADGLKQGHVLEVYSRRLERRDPVTGEKLRLPDLKVGTMIIFMTYEQVSYAILMESTAAIKIGDRASTP